MPDARRHVDAKYDERLKLLLAVADKLFNGDTPRQVGVLIVAFDATDPQHCHFKSLGLQRDGIVTMCQNVIDGLVEKSADARKTA